MKAGCLNCWGQAWVCLAVCGFQTAVVANETAPTATWPKSIDTPQGRCTVFQPRPATLDGERLTARAALAVAPNDSTNVVFGIAQLQARAVPDSDGNQTTVSEVVLKQTSFAPANATAMAGLADALKPELAQVTWTVPSEELRTGLDAVELEQTAARGLNSSPPRILYSPKPAALVVLDGPPQLRTLTNSPLMRVVNTPYAMVFEPVEKRYWLQGSYEWFSTTDWRGEWTPVAQPPAEIAAAVPPVAATNAPALGKLTDVSPRIIVATEPSELVVTRGEATYTPVAGSDLLYVSNSDQLLFFTLDTKEYYVAFSGRWYRGPALTGPWETVPSDKLPPAFAQIAPGSPKSEALTYVAGTVEAQDAVLQAKIPQITAVERGPANVAVAYDGTPQFQPVENTGVQYATNTVDAVFLVRGNYYMCRDAVWYTGPGPEGPWSVAASAPVEIQSLPPSNPHYSVKYVYVYGSTPEEVYVGYEPGYAGCYVYGPTVVYGTGWWYPGYWGPSYCWAYPATFGFGFGYNSWCGWSVSVGLGYGWLGCGYGWGWRGCYPWGWWGPCGAYWACAPRYPYYDHRRHGGDGHGGRGDRGGRPPGPPGGGGDHAGRPPGPPPGSARSEPRPDAPSPWARPSNPQRRTLPSYARTAKAPSEAPTALRSARGLEPRSSVAGQPSRVAPPTRMEAANRQAAFAPRTAPGNGVTRHPSGQPGPQRSAGTTPSGGPRAAGTQPVRSAEVRNPTAPTRSAPTLPQASLPNQPDRVSATPRYAPGQTSPTAPSRTAGVPANNWPGGRPTAPATRAPTMTAPAATRASTSPAPPAYSRPPVSTPTPTQAPSRSWPGATRSYAPSAPRSAVRSPSFASVPVYSSAARRPPMPSYSGSTSRAPLARAPVVTRSAPMRGYSSPGFSAPTRYSAPTRGSFSPSVSAPTRSAPMRSSGGFSGGSFSRGGSARGR